LLRAACADDASADFAKSQSGLIDISDRSLTILDPAGFRRVALMR
jgi:hypothetical protein